MKFHFRWHQIERSGEKKVASSTPPLTISGVESNQGGVRLKFLVCFFPRPPLSVIRHLIMTNVADESGASSAYSIMSIYSPVKTTEPTVTFIVCSGEIRGGKRRQTSRNEAILPTVSPIGNSIYINILCKVIKQKPWNPAIEQYLWLSHSISFISASVSGKSNPSD